MSLSLGFSVSVHCPESEKITTTNNKYGKKHTNSIAKNKMGEFDCFLDHK
jgi:hypothetical protein